MRPLHGKPRPEYVLWKNKAFITTGCHIDASITHSPRKPKPKPSCEVVNDREQQDDESSAKAAMQVVEVT